MPLEIATPSDREIRMTRQFAAPPELVFDAHTVPALIKRWYGPPGWELLLCEIDLRPGGAWRFLGRQPGGREIGQYGVIRDVSRPHRIVQTENWEDWNPGEVLVTNSFEPANGGTLLTVTTLFPSQKVRDVLIEHGMTDGAEASYGKLDALLAEQSAPPSPSRGG
jgi:uncharacterized protein YndB with AHSA1/START domain